jgi:histidine triad (HIT) family protein
VQEWLNWLVSKTSVRATVPRVRIPPSPPKNQDHRVYLKNMEDSIFTKIIKGDIPCHKVYEDKLTLAFLDIHPIQPGHTLVIPKKQVASLWDLDEDDYRAVMATTKKVAERLREVFADKTHVAMEVEGLDVPHAHVKVFPFSTSAEFHRLPDDASIEPDHFALAKIAIKLKF